MIQNGRCIEGRQSFEQWQECRRLSDSHCSGTWASSLSIWLLWKTFQFLNKVKGAQGHLKRGIILFSTEIRKSIRYLFTWAFYKEVNNCTPSLGRRVWEGSLSQKIEVVWCNTIVPGSSFRKVYFRCLLRTLMTFNDEVSSTNIHGLVYL